LKKALLALSVSATILSSLLQADQTVIIDGGGPARRFDGIGAVSGGGGTSVLLKDYPETQRRQILDLLFQPNFGASISALYVEVGGDGNSTQGSELSHMHFRGDENYHRGYEWWLMKEAKSRNPDLSLDACAWSCPGWIGNGDFYSQDMCDYYADWIRGLQMTYGLRLDALGCRNEKGVHEAFAEMLRRTLDADGLNRVVIHGFDNWEPTKWDWCRDLNTNAVLRHAIGVLGNHTLGNVFEKNGPTPDSVKKLSVAMDKPIWDTEEHIYQDGYECEISLVKSFNLNFISAGATKIVNWYLEDSLYGVEAYKTKPAMLIADSPWSGHYSVREALWGYAHYGQFSKIGWKYLCQACGLLANGGTYVTLMSPGGDYSVIAETSDAKQKQAVTFKLAGGVSAGKLCVWRSNPREQFVRQADLTPVNGTYGIILEPNSIYSLSTTTGQQKGSFDHIPPERPFPLPYRETFNYRPASAWGYLPHYTADVAGAFELADRSDGKGECLRQVVSRRAQNWGAEWMPLTLLGDSGWKDYEVSCDILLDAGTGSAGIMGRISTSEGKNSIPDGYLFSLSARHEWALYSTARDKKEAPPLAAGTASKLTTKGWHNLKLQFSGTTITGFLDGTEVCKVSNHDCARGLVGLVTCDQGEARTTACFADLIIKPLGPSEPEPSAFGPDHLPLYSTTR
jgi:galactosylceramidase